MILQLSDMEAVHNRRSPDGAEKRLQEARAPCETGTQAAASCTLKLGVINRESAAAAGIEKARSRCFRIAVLRLRPTVDF